MKTSIFLVWIFVFCSCVRTSSKQVPDTLLSSSSGNTHSNTSECPIAADYIVRLFDKFNIVAIDEGPHGTLQTHLLLRGLFENKKLSQRLQYVILEFANSDYQKILDSYINGDPVDLKELQNVWRESTQAHSVTFQKPIFLQLLEAIRNANKGLPLEDKIRVIAGDPSINWDTINTMNNYFSAITQRDVFPSELAIKYGIDSAKNVLLIYGGEHLKKTSDRKRDSTYWTIPFYINHRHPGTIFTIGAFISEDYPETKIDCPINSIIDLEKDALGLLNVNGNSFDTSNMVLKNVFDAVYYAGPSNEWVQDDATKIDAIFWKELNRRSTIIWGNGIDTNLKDN